jgi:hypothetical protein
MIQSTLKIEYFEKNSGELSFPIKIHEKNFARMCPINVHHPMVMLEGSSNTLSIGPKNVPGKFAGSHRFMISVRVILA